jgi:dihydropyrimidinase
MMDLLVKNGRVVFPDRILETDIGIDDERIVSLGSRASLANGEEEIDAKGRLVFPGGIDPHIHIGTQFMGAEAKDDFFKATKAASWGGTTTIIDFATPKGGDSPVEAASKKKDQASGEVVIDYSLHPTITDVNPESLEEMKELIKEGMPSFKVYLVYRKEGIMVDDGGLIKVMEEAKKQGGLVGCHAENVYMIERLREEALNREDRSAIFHALTRPPVTEAEAVHKAIYLSKYFGIPYYNFHLSIREGVEMFREARGENLPVFAETCTHYLVRNQDDLMGERGINYICTPPLRTEEHREALWKGLEEGVISLVSSDHCGFTQEMKRRGEGSFDQVPNGLPGHEFRIPILFSEGVLGNRINLRRFSEIISTNAAKIFGLYPKKGVIALGSDADLTILDPSIEKTINVEDSLYGMDWYPYEGMKIKGWPTVTISKGKIIWRDGEFHGEKGDGSFIKRLLSKEIFQGPIA